MCRLLFLSRESLSELHSETTLMIHFLFAAKLACQHDGLIDIEGLFFLFFTFCLDFTLFGGRTFAIGEQVPFLLL